MTACETVHNALSVSVQSVQWVFVPDSIALAGAGRKQLLYPPAARTRSLPLFPLRREEVAYHMSKHQNIDRPCVICIFHTECTCIVKAASGLRYIHYIS